MLLISVLAVAILAIEAVQADRLALQSAVCAQSAFSKGAKYCNLGALDLLTRYSTNSDQAPK